MNNFIELHLWDAVKDKGNTPVLVNIGTIGQVMIDYKYIFWSGRLHQSIGDLRRSKAAACGGRVRV